MDLFWGFPGGSAGKESTCNVGNLGLITGLGRSPGEGKGSVFWPGELHGLYSPWGCKELDVTLTFKEVGEWRGGIFIFDQFFISTNLMP